MFTDLKMNTNREELRDLSSQGSSKQLYQTAGEVSCQTGTHCGWVVDRVLNGCGQALLHHAGQAVKLVLLIDLKQAQELPLLP